MWACYYGITKLRSRPDLVPNRDQALESHSSTAQGQVFFGKARAKLLEVVYIGARKCSIIILCYLISGSTI